MHSRKQRCHARSEFSQYLPYTLASYSDCLRVITVFYSKLVYTSDYFLQDAKKSRCSRGCNGFKYEIKTYILLARR